MRNLRQLRKKNKVSQKDLAEMLGVDRSTVGKWEQSPTSYPRASTLYELADIFGCNVDYFFAREGNYIHHSENGERTGE